MAKQAFDSKVFFAESIKILKKFTRSSQYQKALDILFTCWKEEGTVFTLGCGGSASTASHFAADLSKTTITGDKKRFKAISLTDNTPLVSAWTNDSGWNSVFVEQLKPWLKSNDVLVAFSVHGGSLDSDSWSNNLTLAFEFAKEKKARIIGFSGFDGGAMKKYSDSLILIPSSTEPYATPLSEGLHSLINHGLVFELKEKISKSKP